MYRRNRLQESSRQERKEKENKLRHNNDNQKNASSSKHNSGIFQHLFGFEASELRSFKSFVQLLYRPSDPACLGVVRALFGLMMVLDIPEERGLAAVDIRWGDPLECRFPLFNWLQPLPLQWMCLVFLVMWLGALGIMLGLFFRISCFAFTLTYWYIFLLDKASWNNHSYLYGLMAILLLGSEANQYCSLDCIFWPSTKRTPLWNYTILRFQLFVLYFVAGLKKLDLDWLGGYSMTNLANHWVFEPFRFILTPEQIDFWIVHLGGFFLDLTIAFWLFFDKTRLPAMVFCSAFHVMNSQIFSIGMFPYVCLVTMPLFCSQDWPRKIIAWLFSKKIDQNGPQREEKFDYHDNNKKIAEESNITWKHKLVTVLLITHVGAQAFLPYSHFVTQGYNNWTNGLYGYSWDMMVHTWNTILVMVKVVDHQTHQERFLDPTAWVQTDRWDKHADMVVQWAQCIKRNLNKEQNMKNVSVYLDVWSSLNGRFQQRMFDPRIDLLTAEWSPFKRPTWVMPLMTELSPWRKTMTDIEAHVFSWSNYSDVLFVADFPGLTLENFIAFGLSNISLTVLSGDVILEQETSEFEDFKEKRNVSLGTGQSSPILAAAFHYVHTVSSTPACYMYTYTNGTAVNSPTMDYEEDTLYSNQDKPDDWMRHIRSRIHNFVLALKLVWNALLHTIFSVPVPRRQRVG